MTLDEPHKYIKIYKKSSYENALKGEENFEKIQQYAISHFQQTFK